MTYSSTILADSPASYWRLGETSGNPQDSSGNGHHATSVTGTITYGVTGPLVGDADTAISKGASTWAVAPAASLQSGDVLTFECWFKRSAIDVIANIFGNRTVSGTGQVFGITASNQLYAMFGADLYWYLTATSTTTDTNWHHFVVTKNGSDRHGYLDGSEVTNSLGSNTTLSDLTDAWAIGSTGNRDSGPIQGSIDEVAVYSTALTSTQVAAHYAAGTVVTPTWTTPADTVSMSTTPDLKFTSPTSAVKQHFYLQLDTANTFDTGNLRTLDSSTDQTNWTYYNGASWAALPSDGLPIAYAGNEVDYTVTSALSGATWYRRVRAGTLI